MREIKFRAWDKKNKKMTYPFKLSDMKGTRISNQAINGKYHILENCELMQFTGLYDKNSKEIYEGDILCWDDNDTGNIVGEVTFKYGMFNVGNNNLHHYQSSGEMKVIGNIYANPELIE